MLDKYFRLEEKRTNVRTEIIAGIEQGFPAFIIMVMIALSYSISTGLAFGFISFVVIKLVCGKAKDVKITMWIIAALSLAFLLQERIAELITA